MTTEDARNIRQEDRDFLEMLDVFTAQASHEIRAELLVRDLDNLAAQMGIRRLTRRTYWRGQVAWARHAFLAGWYEGQARYLGRRWQRRYGSR